MSLAIAPDAALDPSFNRRPLDARSEQFVDLLELPPECVR